MHDVIDEFRHKRPLYDEFTRRLEDFFLDRIEAKGMENVDIDVRTKTVESFAEKISRPGKQYTDPMRQITDLSGVRIIVCYADDIDRVAEIIRSDFNVHAEESVDKRVHLAPNTFGYLSLHYVISIVGWKETHELWGRFKGLRAEIQIRTILQHSWAMVSHALQYKRDTDVPEQLRRRLFRLAGLFELADEQFIDIRSAHERLTREVSRDFAAGHHGMDVNIISVVELTNSSPAVQQVVEEAAKIPAFTFFDQRAVPGARDDYSLVAEEARRLNIQTVAELERTIASVVPRMAAFLAAVAEIDSWHVTRAFMIFFALMVAHPRRFKASYLMTNRGWHGSIATRISAHALREATA